MVDAHGASMSTKDMKDTRRVEVDFNDDRATPGNRRERDRFRGHDPGRQLQREPPTTNGQPRPPDRRREAFGSTLTSDLSQALQDSSSAPQEHNNESGPYATTDTDPETAQ